MRCLAKDPAERFATAEALSASLCPFAPGNEANLPSPRQASVSNHVLQWVRLWATAAAKTVGPAFESLSRRIPARAVGKAKPFWWNRPMQRRDVWAAVTVALVVISLLSVARALVSVTPNALASRADTTLPSTNASMINSKSLSGIDVGDVNFETGLSISRAADEPIRNTEVAAHTFEPPAVSSAKNPQPIPKPSVTHRIPASLPALPASPSPVSKAPVPLSTQLTSLRIDIVSAVADQALAIYSGDDQLVTVPLRSAHIGDTLRYNCPVAPGGHTLRVVLYRGNKTVFLEKENNSKLRSDGSNAMEVHVTRRSKMLVKHETALEVVWPSTTVSPIAAGIPLNSISAGGLQLR